MSRKNRAFPSPRAGERSSIGDQHVDSATGDINTMAFKTASVMASYELSAEQTLPMIFRDEDLHKLRQIKGMVEPATSIRAYPVQHDAALWIRYDGLSVPTIEPKSFYPQPERIGPLLNYIAAVRAVHDRFEGVKAVLRWLNRNATPGAVRFYWPTAMQLCPTPTIWRDLQDVPTRYSHPPNIGAWLQLLKDAAATVAAAQMLPTTAAVPLRKAIWLTFPRRTVLDPDSPTYVTDEMTYNT